MLETLQDLKTRRSCRSYRPDPVDPKQLDAILEAGTYAPTAMGQQSPVIVAVTDRAVRDRISALNAAVMGSNGDPFYGAPVVLVVFANRKVGKYIEDGNLVMGNLLNAAHAVGVDSCYIYRAREVFETPEGRELMHSFGLSDDYVGIGNCILGYGNPDGIRPAKPRKEDYIIRV